jgi:hypothetical protein
MGKWRKTREDKISKGYAEVSRFFGEGASLGF